MAIRYLFYYFFFFDSCTTEVLSLDVLCVQNQKRSLFMSPTYTEQLQDHTTTSVSLIEPPLQITFSNL